MIWLGYRDAAARAGVDVRSVRRWRAQGLRFRERPDGAREFREDQLLEWKRRQAFANPRRRRRDRDG